MLPVKAIGKMLSKAQTEEEVKGSCDGNDDAMGDAAKYIDLINHTYPDFSIEQITRKKRDHQVALCR